jgi:hypothetical protein
MSFPKSEFLLLTRLAQLTQSTVVDASIDTGCGGRAVGTNFSGLLDCHGKTTFATGLREMWPMVTAAHVSLHY